MFSKHTFTTLVAAVALAGVAYADVTPSEPGPGSSYTAGGDCTITWEGDKESTTAWKDMSIQLMTGSNLQMVHITTVATGQDGTVDGRFSYKCPEVNPYSAIYFYQFTAAGTTTKTWATRFTITAPDGSTTPPSNPTQPGNNQPIPWGTGALADPSTAVGPPASAGGSGTPANATSSTMTTNSTTTTSTTATRSSTTSSPAASTQANTTKTNTTADRQNAENAASGVVVSGSLVLGSFVAVASSALALALGL